jgi:hypothetical protein
MIDQLRTLVLVLLLLEAGVALAQTGSPVSDPFAYSAASDNFETPPEISPNAERWRYSYQNGYWWYASPDRRLLYWSQGRWVEYLPPGRSNTPTYVQPPVPTRQVRWRPFAGRAGVYRPYPTAMPYNSAALYYGRPAVGVY